MFKNKKLFVSFKECCLKESGLVCLNECVGDAVDDDDDDREKKRSWMLGTNCTFYRQFSHTSLLDRSIKLQALKNTLTLGSRNNISLA